MADTERLEPRGPRGEACIIIRSWPDPNTSKSSGRGGDRGTPSYRLASGQRLNTTDDPAVFETLDQTRQFTLR